MLFNSIAELKTFVGGAANISMELDSIKPTIDEAAWNHIVPVLGEEQWQDLTENFASPGADRAALLPYVQKPLAMLTLYEYAKIGNIQFGEAGIFRIESDSHKTAYKYQENQYKNYMLHQGYEAIERMQKFLDQNDNTYTVFASSDALGKARGLMINYVTDFRAAYSKYLSRYTFEIIRTIIEEIEIYAIEQFLGTSQYQRIKTGIKENNLTVAEQELLKRLQKAIAHFTILEAVARTWVRLEGKNVLQSEELDNQSYVKTKPATNIATGFFLQKQQINADRLMQYVKEYLEANLSTFTLYDDYQKSLISAEETSNNNPSDCTNPVWSRFPKQCTEEDSKGIIRL